MGAFRLSVKNSLIAAVFMPFLTMAVAFSTPVFGDTPEKAPRMTFDSVGSMLQDMDREHTQAEMERYALSNTTPHSRNKACKEEEHARAQMSAEQIRTTIAAMEEQWMASVLTEEDVIEVGTKSVNALPDSQF